MPVPKVPRAPSGQHRVYLTGYSGYHRPDGGGTKGIVEGIVEPGEAAETVAVAVAVAVGIVELAGIGRSSLTAVVRIGSHLKVPRCS